MEPSDNCSLMAHHHSLGLSPGDITDFIEREEEAEYTISIADAVSSGMVVPSSEAAYGRSELHPSTVKSLRRSGVLPMSKATFNDRARLRANKGLLERLSLMNTTLADTKGYRVRLAYRIIRYMARIRGDVPGFSTLATALQDAWHVPQRFDITTGYSIGTKGIRSILHAWSTSGNTFTYHDGERLKTVRGITYLPPQIPDSFYVLAGAESQADIWRARASRSVPEGYRTEDDEALRYFCDSMEMLCERLSVHEGTEMEPEAGVMGMAGLLSPQTARIAWPTVDELTMYEDELVVYIYDQIIKKSSSNNIEQEIMRQFGVERQEAMDLYKMSQEVGSLIYREDMEHARITMINRLGRLADHAESFDVRVSLAAIKEQGKLKGLNRTEESSEMNELRSFATRAVEFNERD